MIIGKDTNGRTDSRCRGVGRGWDTCNGIAFDGIGGPGAGVSCFAADMLPM